MKSISLLAVTLLLTVFTSQSIFAQKVTSSFMFGWATPQGDAFEDSKGEKMAGGGLAFDFDVMYHLSSKLSAGLAIQNNLLFAVSSSEFEAGLYALNLYGVKGEYRFSEGKVAPYGGLSLGVSQFGTPEVTDASTGDVILEKNKKMSLGIRPEVGVYFGGFKISASYIVPMKYKFEETKLSGGAVIVSLGFRVKWWEK